MECSGRIAALGDGVTDWKVGDEVCALLAGGGYAEKVRCQPANCCRSRPA
nr:alcohol dehydrogenase catalytic domain-containing protein [Fodinicola feengrottensis]